MSINKEEILVTGADGFIGSHLVELLYAQGYNVRALSQYNSFNNWGWLEEISCQDKIEIISGDIRDPFFCREIMKDIDYVFHLAALIAIPYSYIAPQSYVETNIVGTLNICQAALENKVKKVIHTSTSEVYGTALYVPIDEKHPLQPQSPYSASKIGADAMAMSYYNSFDLQVVVARPFNTYGPRQSARAVIPTIISQIASGKKEIKLGDMTPTRDFNFVKDTCKALYSLLSVDAAVGNTINIGSNTEISIKELFYTINEIMGGKVEFIEDQQRIRPEKSEVFRLKCDNHQLVKLTGYTPGYDIRAGLKETIDWFTKDSVINKYKPELYNV